MASRIKTSQGWEGSLRACPYMLVQRGLFSGCATEGNEETLALGPWKGPYKCEVYFFNYLFIYFWLHWIFVAFSSCGEWGLLTAVASLEEHRL